MIVFALLLGLPGLVQAAPAILFPSRVLTVCHVRSPYSLDAILDAIRSTESGGQRNGGRDATGDGGRAIGPYQIHRAYFLDAGVPGRYEDCRDPSYSRRVVIAYWKRWCPDALEHCDAEVLARVHNGGPKGAHKSNTQAYWREVERRLVAASTRQAAKSALPSANSPCFDARAP